MEKDPDVLFLPAYFAEGGTIIKQARELGATFRIMGGDAMDNPEMINLIGDASEGFIHTSFPYDASMPKMTPQAKAFTEAWEATYHDKKANANAALGYTSYVMLIDAIKRAGEAEAQAITNALATIKDLPTPLGKLTLDGNHDPLQMPVGIIEIKDGQRIYIGEITPQKSKLPKAGRSW